MQPLNPRTTLSVGQHRPIYLWAGPGTARMNRLKFLGAPVNEAVHMEAHTLTGARHVVQECRCNWVYLSFNWGFPPEVEQEDWESFRQAAEAYHKLGALVFAYIQTSNYVLEGSFRHKDWFARDPSGKPFYYYTGRYMACWLHPEWQEHLQARIKGAIERSADGIFFDNPWFGAQPFFVDGTWLGSAGCHCERCQRAFRDFSGLSIPKLLDPEHDQASQIYLRWRAAQVTQTLGRLASYARALKPDVLISANNFDAVMRPSYLIYGIDIEGLGAIQDVLMIEDYGLPQCSPASGGSPAILINNAITLRTARALCPKTPISTLPYNKGIGLDRVYGARQFKQSIAEAAACGAAAVIKGTEFRDYRNAFTLLTDPAYDSQRAAVGLYHDWIERHSSLFSNEWENCARIGLVYPGDSFWQKWGSAAARFFKVAQGLTALGVPWKVIRSATEANCDVVVDVCESSANSPLSTRLSSDLSRSQRSLLSRSALLKRASSTVATRLYNAYFERRLVRRLGDKLGLVHFFDQRDYFRLPNQFLMETLEQIIAPAKTPRAFAAAPVLVEHWHRRTSGEHTIRLVNYADAPQTVRLVLPSFFCGQVVSPDSAQQSVEGAEIHLKLDVFAVLVGSLGTPRRSI